MRITTEEAEKFSCRYLSVMFDSVSEAGSAPLRKQTPLQATNMEPLTCTKQNLFIIAQEQALVLEKLLFRRTINKFCGIRNRMS